MMPVQLTATERRRSGSPHPMDAQNVEVVLTKTDPSSQVFGFTNVPEVDPDGRVCLRITEVSSDGLLAEWNAWHPHISLGPGDCIFSVNGVEGNLAQMRGLLCGSSARLGIKRVAASSRWMVAAASLDQSQVWPGAAIAEPAGKTPATGSRSRPPPAPPTDFREDSLGRRVREAQERLGGSGDVASSAATTPPYAPTAEETQVEAPQRKVPNGMDDIGIEVEELQRLREVLLLATEKKETEVRRWRQSEEQMATQVANQHREIEELRGWQQRSQQEAAEAAREAVREEREAKLRQEAQAWRRQEEQAALQVAAKHHEVEEHLQECRQVQEEASLIEASLQQEMQELKRNADSEREVQMRQRHEMAELMEEAQKLKSQLQKQQDAQNMAWLVTEQELERQESEIQELLFAVALEKQNSWKPHGEQQEPLALLRGGNNADVFQLGLAPQHQFQQPHRADAERRWLPSDKSSFRREGEVSAVELEELVRMQSRRRATDVEELQALRKRCQRQSEEIEEQGDEIHDLLRCRQAEQQMASLATEFEEALEALRQGDEGADNALRVVLRPKLGREHQEEVARLAHREQAISQECVRRITEMALELELVRRPHQEAPRALPTPLPRELAMRELTELPASRRPEPPVQRTLRVLAPAAAPSPKMALPAVTDYVATADDELDRALERCVANLGSGCLGGLALTRAGKGYKFGSKRLFLKLDGTEVKVRHGSSFAPFGEWLRAEVEAQTDDGKLGGSCCAER